MLELGIKVVEPKVEGTKLVNARNERQVCSKIGEVGKNK